ncbi:TPA: flagellar assembly protein FliW [bacterium]|nr:MAG: flagellar assembly protein FliW [Candidatus Hydrogenedentes bacterium CG07_land_8_20_14_0_80_42_17]HBW47181.1 flagellar assembly protein FliW [bacterium]
MTTSENKRLIKTRFGKEVEITDKNLVTIKDGLLGFETYESYAVIPHGDESPFLWLQSLDEPQLAFITIDPRIFAQDYVPNFSENELSSIELTSISEAVLLAIVVIPDDPKLMTANLQAPIVLNAKNRQGKQMISSSQEHKVRHYILGKNGEPPEKK